jgi:hypothetical protein
MHRMQWGHPWFACHLWVGWPPFAQSLCAHMRAGQRGGGGFPCGPHLHTSTCKQREGATRQQGACSSPSTGHPVSCTQGGDGVEMGVVLSLQPICWAGRGQKGGSTISYMAVPPPPPALFHLCAPLMCRSRDKGAEGLCHAPGFLYPLGAQRRPPFVHEQGQDQQGSGSREGVLCLLSC